MKLSKYITIITIVSMWFTIAPVGNVFADASKTKLIVHYYKSQGDYKQLIEAISFDNQETGKVVDVAADAFGLTMTFEFEKASSQSYLGFTVKEDSVFHQDKRFVRASNGVAEAWVIDGDAKVYSEPKLVDPSVTVTKNKKVYIAVEDLPTYLGITYSYGKNGYLFDGHAAKTIDIVTMFQNRDYFEIAVDYNRIGYNVTGNMLNYYNDIVFTDVDGYRDNGKYYLSLGYIERLFQVGSLVGKSGAYLLPKQYTAYDRIEQASPEAVGFSSEKLAELDKHIEGFIEEGFPSMSMIVVKDGKIVKQSAYGYSKKYSTSTVDGVLQEAQLLPQAEWERATVDTLYDLASNSKMYATNYAIQKLVSEGKLNLDQTLQSFPGWENFKDDYTVYSGKFTVNPNGPIKQKFTGKETVTIRDILHHYGGLIPDPEYPNQLSAGELWYQSDDFADRSGIIDIISKTPLQYEPKKVYAYSDVDYMILGLLVEQITGLPLDQYVEEQIYAPLGLSKTMFRPLEKGVPQSSIAATELNGNTRDGFISFGDNVPIRKYTLQGEVHDEKAYYSMDGVSGHAGLFSNTADMGALTQVMLNGGIYNGSQVFSKEVADEFITPYHPDPAKVNSSTTGLGWRIHSYGTTGYFYFNWGPSRNTYGHQGWTGTMTIIDPIYNMSIVLLANYRHSPVIEKPNGFEAAQFDLADFVTASGRVYNALLWDKEQYSPIKSVAESADISVDYDTSLTDALAALPAKTTITAENQKAYEVALNWTIQSYDGKKAGTYTANGSFELPAGVVQTDPETALSVSVKVTVKAEVKNNGPDSNVYNPIIPGNGQLFVDGKALNVFIPTEDSSSNGVSTRLVTIPQHVVEELLKSVSENGTISIQNQNHSDRYQVKIQAAELVKLQKQAKTIEIVSQHGKYVLPEIDIKKLASQFKPPVKEADITIAFTIANASMAWTKELKASLEKNNILLLSNPVDFVAAASVKDQTVTLQTNGAYTSRWLPIPAAVSPHKVTTGVRIDEKGNIYHMPTAITKVGNTTYAKISSLTNSWYGLIQYNAAMPAKLKAHWSKEHAANMANRLVLNDVEQFQPDHAITRAQFTNYITRALGIFGTKTENPWYSDVRSSDEHADAISIAASYGIIKGYKDGTFRPDALIS